MATFIDEEEGKQEELFDTLEEDQTEQVAEEQVEAAQEEPLKRTDFPSVIATRTSKTSFRCTKRLRS
jgi:hypothetical protein